MRTARWRRIWVSLVSSRRRWLRLGVVRRVSWVASRALYRWVSRALVKSSASTASPSQPQEEVSEASGHSASLAGVESLTYLAVPAAGGSTAASDHAAAASPQSDVLDDEAAVLNASSPTRLPELATVLAIQDPSTPTTSPSNQGPESTVHGVAASRRSDAPAIAVLQAGRSLAGVAPVEASTLPSPPARCVGAITSLEVRSSPPKIQNAAILEGCTSDVVPPLWNLCQQQQQEEEEDEMVEEEEEEQEEEEDEVVVVEEQQQQQEEEKEDDPDKKTYARYLSHVAETPKHSIVCLICFLGKGQPKMIHKSCTTGIKCEKTGCLVRAKYKGDIGRHNKYCHELKAGWWKKPHGA